MKKNLLIILMALYTITVTGCTEKNQGPEVPISEASSIQVSVPIETAAAPTTAETEVDTKQYTFQETFAERVPIYEESTQPETTAVEETTAASMEMQTVTLHGDISYKLPAETLSETVSVTEPETEKITEPVTEEIKPVVTEAQTSPVTEVATQPVHQDTSYGGMKIEAATEGQIIPGKRNEDLDFEDMWYYANNTSDKLGITEEEQTRIVNAILDIMNSKGAYADTSQSNVILDKYGSYDAYIQRMVAEINRLRANNGVGPVEWSDNIIPHAYNIAVKLEAEDVNGTYKMHPASDDNIVMTCESTCMLPLCDNTPPETLAHNLTYGHNNSIIEKADLKYIGIAYHEYWNEYKVLGIVIDVMNEQMYNAFY